MKHILFALIASCPIAAFSCPQGTDYAALQSRIIAELQVSAGPTAAHPLTQALWETWLDAPDAKAQAMLDRGMQLREGMDYFGSRVALDALVAYCPDYAEGYNQRAFSSFLTRDYGAALADLDRAIALLPNHIAAISGRGLTLMGLGRLQEADDTLRAALALNPWLTERQYLIAPESTDI